MTTETTTTTTCTDCQRIEAEELAHETHRAECAEHTGRTAAVETTTATPDEVPPVPWSPLIHVLPCPGFGDAPPHVAKAGACWCEPQPSYVTFDGEPVMVHREEPTMTPGRLIAVDPPGDEEARSHTVNTNNPRLRSNNSITNDPCAYCGATTDPCGFDVMAPIPVAWSPEPSYSALVCHDCAETRAPGQEAFGQALAHMNGALLDVPVEAWPEVLAVVEEWARAYMHYVNVGPVAFWSETPAEATP